VLARAEPCVYEAYPDAASAALPAQAYRQRQPQRTALHRLVRENLRTFLAEGEARSEHGAGYPYYVEKEFRDYLLCGLCKLMIAANANNDDDRRVSMTSPVQVPTRMLQRPVAGRRSEAADPRGRDHQVVEPALLQHRRAVVPVVLEEHRIDAVLGVAAAPVEVVPRVLKLPVDPELEHAV